MLAHLQYLLQSWKVTLNMDMGFFTVQLSFHKYHHHLRFLVYIFNLVYVQVAYICTTNFHFI